MKKLYVIIFVVLIVHTTVFSQSCVYPAVKFDVTEFDFGKINENDGKVTHRFDFTNAGFSPLIINNVNVTCGCTTSGWSKEPIEPGAKGYIDASFNPKGRPGRFTRSYTVLSNAENSQIVLKLSGEVISELPVIEKGSAINFKTTSYEFKVKEGEQVKYSYVFENIGSAPLIIKEVQTSCDCVKVEAKNSTIGSGMKGEIVATFNTTNEVGKHDVIITILSNATNSETTKLKFSGEVLK